MLIKTTKLIAIIACALLPLSTTFAQQNQTQTKQTESQWVDFSGFKGKIFDIKNRDPIELINILQPLGSGFKGAIMKSNSEYKTITVRDFPENLATIEEAIKRLDVQLPPKPTQHLRPIYPDIEVFAYVLIASNGEGDGAPSPPMLADVIKQLQTTLNYKSYQLLTSIVQRTNYENGSIDANGMAEFPDKSLSGKYALQIAINPTGIRQPDQITLSRLLFQMEGFKETNNGAIGVGDTKINTRLQVRDGEKVVVGTASLRDKAVILVLTTKILK